MLKQIWTVRSLRGLIWGLSFAASLVSLAYAALCCVVLGDGVLWETASGAARTVPAWRLLAPPVASLLLCAALWLDSRRKSLPSFLRPLTAEAEPARVRQLALFLDAEAGTCFLAVLWFFLRSMRQTSFAKGLEPFPAPVLWLAPAALAVWWAAAWVRLRRLKRER